jgi:predicted nucleotidyltransferase
MVEQSVLEIVAKYLQVVNAAGIRVKQAVLFGSWARGDATSDSDIDLIVIAPEFDGSLERELVSRLWRLRVAIPEAWRIEPIACGERQWLEDDASAIIEIARQEGELITFEPEAA